MFLGRKGHVALNYSNNGTGAISPPRISLDAVNVTD